MVRIIDVCSGKGGVGKTTVASNLGLALQKLGKKVAVIDFNFTTSHLSLCFNSYSHPITLNSVLRNEASMQDAMFTHSSGLKVVPGSLRLEDIVNVDASDIRKKIIQAFSDYDFVLLDSAPGLGREAIISIEASDEALYVANPTPPSIIDITKCNQVASIKNVSKPIGIIVNRVKNKSYEISNIEISQFTGLPVIGAIPEDENVLESTNKEMLVTLYKKNAPSSRAFFEIASKLTGAEYKKPGLLRGILKRLW
jgi:septum site-determining protein MinD